MLGAEPGAAALAAAQEVAHVLVTYNGQVCFTPYFASASTGTASSAEVWGGERAWLQAVDSPYDQQVSSNWNTNGNSSGTARFSRETLENRIRDELGIDLAGVDPNSWFTIKSANQYGWVAKIQVGPDAASAPSAGAGSARICWPARALTGAACAASASRSAMTPIWIALSLMCTVTATAAA